LAIADIAYHNKAAIYDILFKATAETLTTIAGDPKHLGARIGFTAVLHRWGSAMTHHPQGALEPSGRTIGRRRRLVGQPEMADAAISGDAIRPGHHGDRHFRDPSAMG